MIFKRWFQPKWQHADAAVRQLAIASLDHNTPAQKQILHELAFNDAAESVRKTALERLNEFSLWWQASKHESAERLKQFAEQQLIEMLLKNQVSAQLKHAFIAECHRSSILEKLAQHETDPALKLDLLKRLQREDLYIAALVDESIPLSQRRELMPSIQDDKALEKFSRHCSADIAALITDELALRAERKLKPERTRKQVVLLLAKLNALREKSDVLDIQQRLQQHQLEWQALTADLAELPEHAEFAAKYAKVITLTEKNLAPRLADIAEQQALQQQKERQQQTAQQFDQQLTLLADQMAKQLANGELAAASACETAVTQLSGQIEQADISQAAKQQLQQRLQQLQNQLSMLPALTDALTAAARLIAEMSAQPLPAAAEDVAVAYQAFKQWQQQWQRQRKVLQQWLPANFADSYQQLTLQWQQHCEPVLAQQEKQLRLLRSKIAEFKRLHQAGKFNVLFGLMKGIQTDLAALPSSQQQLLSKDIEQLQQQVQELTDLQAYIATPRKQQLLAEVQQWLTETEVQPTQRAAAVKQARAQWNSFGRADAELEQSLNDAFNLACEQAFAPCREFFAQQDAERAANAEQKQQVIAELLQAIEQQLTGKALDALLVELPKRWQSIGPVEKTVHEQLHPQYQQGLAQLRQLQKQSQQANAQAKQQLIDTAKALTDQPAAENVAAQLKVLQQQWKQLGFAGRQHDQTLWQQFRTVCDGWFQQQQAQRAEQQSLQQQQYVALQHQLEPFDLDPTELSQVDLKQQLSQLQQLDTSGFTEIAARQAQLILRFQQALTAVHQQAEQQAMQQLFDALQQPNPALTDLPAIYRLVFNQGKEKLLSRADLTLALEWAAGVSSPDAEHARRQQVQILLLTDKHSSGEAITQAHLFARWLQYGPVTAEEQPLLARVRALYLPE